MPAKRTLPLALFKKWQREDKECADMEEAKQRALADHARMWPAYIESSSLVMRFPSGAMEDLYSRPLPFLLTVMPVEADEFYIWRKESRLWVALDPRWRVIIRGDPYQVAKKPLGRGGRPYVFARTYVAPRSSGTALPILEAAE